MFCPIKPNVEPNQMFGAIFFSRSEPAYYMSIFILANESKEERKRIKLSLFRNNSVKI